MLLEVLDKLRELRLGEVLPAAPLVKRDGLLHILATTLEPMYLTSQEQNAIDRYYEDTDYFELYVGNRIPPGVCMGHSNASC